MQVSLAVQTIFSDVLDTLTYDGRYLVAIVVLFNATTEWSKCYLAHDTRLGRTLIKHTSRQQLLCKTMR